MYFRLSQLSFFIISNFGKPKFIIIFLHGLGRLTCSGIVNIYEDLKTLVHTYNITRQYYGIHFTVILVLYSRY
jgi:hypothetical protein